MSYSRKELTKEQIQEAITNTPSMIAALQSLGLSGGSNYKRVYELLNKKTIT